MSAQPHDVPSRDPSEEFQDAFGHSTGSGLGEDLKAHADDYDLSPRAGDLFDDDAERESTSTVALFEGDEGGLELGQRRALVYLLKNRFISAQSHPREWRALVTNPRPIRARLNDLFMELHLDADREVAYKRHVSPEGGGRAFPTLLYDVPWGREETILLVYLRARHRSEHATGAERVFVDREDMLENVARYRPEGSTDLAGDAKKATRAIETVFKSGLLIGRSDADRFEISNAIEVLLSMEKLTELLAWLCTENHSPETIDEPFDELRRGGDHTDAAPGFPSEKAAEPESETHRDDL